MVQTRRGRQTGRVEQQKQRQHEYYRTFVLHKIRKLIAREKIRNTFRRQLQNHELDNNDAFDYNPPSPPPSPPRRGIRNHVRQEAPDAAPFPNRNRPVLHRGHQHPIGQYDDDDECHRHRMNDNVPKTQTVRMYRRRVPLR